MCAAARAWVRSLFVELAGQLDAVNADALGRQLVMLYDGATVAAQLDKDPSAAAQARAAAAALMESVMTANKFVGAVDV